MSNKPGTLKHVNQLNDFSATSSQLPMNRTPSGRVAAKNRPLVNERRQPLSVPILSIRAAYSG